MPEKLEPKGEGKKKVDFAAEINCPHCQLMISIEAGKIIKEPSVKAKTEEFLEVKKSKQSTLESGKDIDEENKKKK